MDFSIICPECSFDNQNIWARAEEDWKTTCKSCGHKFSVFNEINSPIGISAVRIFNEPHSKEQHEFYKKNPDKLFEETK